MSVCEDRHPGADDWLRQHSQIMLCIHLNSTHSHPLRNVCAGHRRLVLPMFTNCYVLLSLDVVKHCCIFLCFIFLGRPGLSSLSLTTFVPFIRFTILRNTRLRRWVSGRCDWIHTCSLTDRFFSYYFIMFTNLSDNQSQSVRIHFDARKRVSVLDVLRFLFSHSSAKMGGFLWLIFYSVDIDCKPAD